jgi:hypothetical protein
MEPNARGFPPGDLRVSDAERDRALSELSEAYQTGRITADEFDRRSTQALVARTGEELTAPLADLPLHRGRVEAAPADAATPRRADSYLVPRLTIGASLTAICFGGVAVTNVLHPGVDWTGTLTPAAVAVLCVVLVIVLQVRTRRGPLLGRRGQPGQAASQDGRIGPPAGGLCNAHAGGSAPRYAGRERRSWERMAPECRASGIQWFAGLTTL